MLEEIKKIDKDILLGINQIDNPVLNTIMYWFSNNYVWIPLYVFLAYILYKVYQKQAWKVILAALVVFTLCDQISSYIKNKVCSHRPSHDIDLEGMVKLSEYGPGGRYGFVSSHSTNVFGLATFLALILPKEYRKLKIVMFFWAFMVAISRVYNGVHYPKDIVCGAILGAIIATVVFVILNKFIVKDIK